MRQGVRDKGFEKRSIDKVQAKDKKEDHRKRRKEGHLEHHLELRGKREECSQHGAHGHEHELKEQQPSQVVHPGNCAGLPRLQPEQP